MRQIIKKLALAAPLIFAHPARSQLLDALLPPSIPGYGQRFSVIADHRTQAPGATGFALGGLTAAPSLALAGGYDSAPGAARASPSWAATPSLSITDPDAALGFFAQLDSLNYPNDAAQNTNNTLLALGDAIALPRENIILSAANLRGAAGGFSFNTSAITQPVRFTLTDLRARDDLSAGMFTLTPDLGLSLYAFDGNNRAANRREQREGLSISFTPGGPLTALLRLHATQILYTLPGQNAAITELLAGLEDQADGLWTFSLLAGVAQRRPQSGPSLTTPVLEARANWMPTSLDQVSLTLRREVDDPDAITAAPYTLTSIKSSISHAYLENVTMKALAECSSATYTHLRLHEFLVTGELIMLWQASPVLAVDAQYRFNTRQTNRLGAANEHVFTLGLTWTP